MSGCGCGCKWCRGTEHCEECRPARKHRGLASPRLNGDVLYDPETNALLIQWPESGGGWLEWEIDYQDQHALHAYPVGIPPEQAARLVLIGNLFGWDE